MSLPHFGKSAVRAAKNYTKGFSHAQVKTRNATCNDPWPPSGKEMFELAQMTYREEDFIDIMEIIDKRMNDKGKNWRHVFKSLVVLDYLLHSGSENVIVYCEENIYVIKTLREFQYIDDEGRDQGANVRQKAKDITNLVMDKNRLHQQRIARSRMQDRMLGRTSTDTDDDDEYQRPYSRRAVSKPFRSQDGQQESLRTALSQSKDDAQARSTAEDRDLQRAIQLSNEEEERRKKLAEVAENKGIFDDIPDANEPLIDLSGPTQTVSMQPQYTAMQPQYTLQPQLTSIMPQFTSIQPQFTSFNPYLQQSQQEAMQQEYLRQQAEYTRQQFEVQQAQAQYLLQQQQQVQQHQPQPLSPQRTALGSNNPFIDGPSSPTIYERPITSPPRTGVSINATGTYEQRPITTAFDEGRRRERPSYTMAERRGENQKLANLFANYTGDGVDTFGNVGALRFGQTEHGRLIAQRTGISTNRTGEDTNNPFLM